MLENHSLDSLAGYLYDENDKPEHVIGRGGPDYNGVAGKTHSNSVTVNGEIVECRVGTDLPPRTSPPSKLDSEPFEVHSTG